LRATRIGTAEADRVVECPLRHTDYRVRISGLLARVTVTQVFVNPHPEPIEAVYVFPLPHRSAVDEMVLTVADRRTEAVIMRRNEARTVYEAAISVGQTAALLEQERPNIFTQSVGNIPPGGEVRVEIGFTDVSAVDGVTYELALPLVVGPRYNPGQPVPGTAPVVAPEARRGGGATDRVPDGDRINPPILAPGTRSGHEVAIAVELRAGVPIAALASPSHQVAITHSDAATATVTLVPADALPNKDFVLRYQLGAAAPQVAVLAQADRTGGGHCLIFVQPATLTEDLQDERPQDLCFLIDVSGSMSGEPTEIVRGALRALLDHTRPGDRIQVIAFAGQATPLFPDYRAADAAAQEAALAFDQRGNAGGGTEMLAGVRAALTDPPAGRVRTVIMLTDGFIGNEDEIIAEADKRCHAALRLWVVGIGSSSNRHLVDGVAAVSGGRLAITAAVAAHRRPRNPPIRKPSVGGCRSPDDPPTRRSPCPAAGGRWSCRAPVCSPARAPNWGCQRKRRCRG
jgi:Ca-activated chloride channel family protein